MELTRVGFAKLPELPEQSGPDVSGTLLQVDPAQVVLRVPVNVRRDGIVTGTIAQDVIIPIADVVDVSHKQLSRGRTALVLGGGVGILAGLFTAFGPGGPPSGSDRPGPIDQEAGSLVASLQLLRLPLR
jgi:hypothetical protein